MRTLHPGVSRSWAHPQVDPAKPQVVEETLDSCQLTIERKTFLITLKENRQGRFCRITEEVRGRRSTVIVPTSGLAALVTTLTRMMQVPEQPAEPIV